MYEVYINETPFRLLATENATALPSNERNLVGRYPGKSKFLLNYIDMLEKNDTYESVSLHSDDLAQLIADFESLYKILEAGGGLVFNEKGETLFIFRRDFWDLPKGKIDKGETKEQAAVREVQEETGLQQVTLGDFICETNHTYKNKKGKRIIKRTYWYHMTTTDMELIPETEEDIEQAIWQRLDKFISLRPRVYKNIMKVIRTYLNSPF